MADEVVFNEDPDWAFSQRNRAPSGFAGRLIAWGIVKDERGAKYVLLGVIFFCALASAALFKESSSLSSSYGNLDTILATHPEVFQNEPPPAR